MSIQDEHFALGQTWGDLAESLIMSDLDIDPSTNEGQNTKRLMLEFAERFARKQAADTARCLQLVQQGLAS